MSIEKSSPSPSAKAVTGADPHGKKSGKAPDASGGSGFSALMSLLSATEEVAVGPVADPLLAAGQSGLDEEAAVPVDGAGLLAMAQGLAAPVTVTPQDLLQVTQAAPSGPEAAAQPLLAAGDLPEIPVGRPQAKAGDTATAALQMVQMRNVGKAAPGDGNAVMATAAPQVSDVSPASVLLAHRGVMQAHAAQMTQHDLKETRAAAASQSTGMAAELVSTVLAGVAGEMARPQGRFGARPGFGQSGSSGADGAFGQAMAATHRSDAVFEVPPASAVVADTAVAETVSYWASQGVQTAELELEGFGDSPVEVSIVLNGDQAQIDFRTDQAGVRQVLEAATAQLKDLLSSQGLQLAGVSVGTSGKGNDQGGERRARPGAQQATLVKTEALGAATTRMANPAVGRSLDLFV